MKTKLCRVCGIRKAVYKNLGLCYCPICYYVKYYGGVSD